MATLVTGIGFAANKYMGFIGNSAEYEEALARGLAQVPATPAYKMLLDEFGFDDMGYSITPD